VAGQSKLGANTIARLLALILFLSWWSRRAGVRKEGRPADHVEVQPGGRRYAYRGERHLVQEFDQEQKEPQAVGRQLPAHQQKQTPASKGRGCRIVASHCHTEEGSQDWQGAPPRCWSNRHNRQPASSRSRLKATPRRDAQLTGMRLYATQKATCLEARLARRHAHMRA
jgi:hypothetical protein